MQKRKDISKDCPDISNSLQKKSCIPIWFHRKNCPISFCSGNMQKETWTLFLIFKVDFKKKLVCFHEIIIPQIIAWNLFQAFQYFVTQQSHNFNRTLACQVTPPSDLHTWITRSEALYCGIFPTSRQEIYLYARHMNCCAYVLILYLCMVVVHRVCINYHACSDCVSDRGCAAVQICE